MNVDPRIMKQLLQLTMLRSTDLFSDSSLSVNNGDASNDFTALLQTLIGGSDFSADDGMTGGDSRALTALNAMPVQSAAWNMTSFTPAAASAINQSAYDPYIQEAAEKFNVNPSLIKSIIQHESSFNPNAVSSAGAKGLMQLMDATAATHGVTDPFDPAQNIEGGTQLIAQLLNKYNGEIPVALAAYNAGSGRLDRLGIRNSSDLKRLYNELPQETQRYVTKVMNSINGYQHA